MLKELGEGEEEEKPAKARSSRRRSRSSADPDDNDDADDAVARDDEKDKRKKKSSNGVITLTREQILTALDSGEVTDPRSDAYYPQEGGSARKGPAVPKPASSRL